MNAAVGAATVNRNWWVQKLRSATNKSSACINGQRPSNRERSCAWPSSARHTSVTSMVCWSRTRSEEHTSELQSHLNLVCRLLLEKKKKKRQHADRPNNTRHTTYNVA